MYRNHFCILVWNYLISYSFCTNQSKRGFGSTKISSKQRWRRNIIELLPATLKNKDCSPYRELFPLHNWLRFSNSSDFLQIYVFTCSISEWRCLQMWKGEVWLVRNKSLQKIGTFKWKKRLELDSAAVGSVSGETVDRLASVEDPIFDCTCDTCWGK